MIPLHQALCLMMWWIPLYNTSWTAILFCFVKRVTSIPRNVWFLPLDTVSSQKCSSFALIVLVFTCSSMCDTLLSSTYKAIVHFILSMVLFAMNLSHGLTTNPCDFKVFAHRSCNNSADSIQPYNNFNIPRYSTFIPFSIRTFYLCYGFTSHIMSADSPSIFNMMNFILAYQHLVIPQGHQIWTRLFLSVSQW